MATNSQYKTTKSSTDWIDGINSYSTITGIGKPSTTGIETKEVPTTESRSIFNIPNKENYANISMIEKKTDFSKVEIQKIQQAKFDTILEDTDKSYQLYAHDPGNMQNVHEYPEYDMNALVNASSGEELEEIFTRQAKYDYQIIPADSRYPISVKLEDKLRDMRASLGIPVHGRRDLAKLMKYYMYNRFKTPDINMAHNKTFTHVFFTRPDCNLLEPRSNGSFGYTLSKHAAKNTEVLLLWKRNPELFKLLVNGSHCGDRHNLNLLLANQITAIDIQDENLSTNEAGKSWNQYEMSYGEVYTGRFAGELSCTFTETSDYSVINLMKLWITYIDAVARGAWSPSYNIGGNGISRNYYSSHVYTKTLDYGASIDVFKTGPDGEEILYWSKYYGIFPINTGASALSWELGNNPGELPKLNIRFKYSFKRDLSPIALLEFNNNTSEDNTYIPAYDKNYAGTVRPYVGTPYIEFTMNEPGLKYGSMVNLNAPTLDIRLKFNKFSHISINDNLLYRNNLNKDI